MSTLDNEWHITALERALWFTTVQWGAERRAHRFTKRVSLIAGAIQVALVFVATFTPWPRPVMLAVPHSVYGLPACPTEDSGLPGGCVFDGGDRGTWIIYTPGRA